MVEVVRRKWLKLTCPQKIIEKAKIDRYTLTLTQKKMCPVYVCNWKYFANNLGKEHQNRQTLNRAISVAIACLRATSTL